MIYIEIMNIKVNKNQVKMRSFAIRNRSENYKTPKKYKSGPTEAEEKKENKSKTKSTTKKSKNKSKKDNKDDKYSGKKRSRKQLNESDTEGIHKKDTAKGTKGKKKTKRKRSDKEEEDDDVESSEDDKPPKKKHKKDETRLFCLNLYKIKIKISVGQIFGIVGLIILIYTL